MLMTDIDTINLHPNLDYDILVGNEYCRKETVTEEIFSTDL